MFAKIISKEFCTVLFLLAHVAGMAYGAPVVLRHRQVDESAGTNNTNVEIVPLVPGTPIDPVLVDLWDRVSNLQQQVNQAQPGSPGFDELVQLLNDTKASLDQQLNGVAVLSTVAATPEPTATEVTASTITETVSTTTLPAESSSTQSASTTNSANLSTTTLPPSSTSINTDVPVVTVVTQVGTSIVVLASQGVTRTVTLATITGVQSATPTSSVVSSTSTLPSGASASGSSSSASTATAPVSSTTLSSIPIQASAVAAAQGGPNSGALILAPAGSQMIMGLMVALVISVLL